ncbi:helix-turn-helix domain-containing protein [Polaribacter sp. IC073]|uniref:helix-turn-helix domain-containing protein n=1 Tax=Polaribacter sp. IC073 TaxID=2508540 RepID=UPI0011BF2624|nr:helix-turn-helix transcriptional regulator [Polaribacter sp. IC073]TXD45871.1 helix-turn-helix transcriptional regulator [Polaribacter sp. IC073]
MLKIKQLRKAKNESQTELSKVVGVSLRTIQNYESGGVDIPSKSLEIIAKHYDVSIAYLFSEENDVVNFKSNKLIHKGIEVPNDLVIDYVCDNWSKLMDNRLFSATFKAEGLKYYLTLKESTK